MDRRWFGSGPNTILHKIPASAVPCVSVLHFSFALSLIWYTGTAMFSLSEKGNAPDGFHALFLLHTTGEGRNFFYT